MFYSIKEKQQITELDFYGFLLVYNHANLTRDQTAYDSGHTCQLCSGIIDFAWKSCDDTII